MYISNGPCITERIFILSLPLNYFIFALELWKNEVIIVYNSRSTVTLPQINDTDIFFLLSNVAGRKSNVTCFFIFKQPLFSYSSVLGIYLFFSIHPSLKCHFNVLYCLTLGRLLPTKNWVWKLQLIFKNCFLVFFHFLLLNCLLGKCEERVNIAQFSCSILACFQVRLVPGLTHNFFAILIYLFTVYLTLSYLQSTSSGCSVALRKSFTLMTKDIHSHT